MAQAGGAVIDQQERTEAGASGDDLGAPFSLPALSKSALTHHPQAGGGTACGSRALSESCRASLPSMDRPADTTGGLCIGRSCTDAPGAWGPSTPNKLRRVYTGALLATTVNLPKRVDQRTDWCYTLAT